MPLLEEERSERKLSSNEKRRLRRQRRAKEERKGEEASPPPPPSSPVTEVEETNAKFERREEPGAQKATKSFETMPEPALQSNVAEAASPVADAAATVPANGIGCGESAAQATPTFYYPEHTTEAPVLDYQQRIRTQLGQAYPLPGPTTTPYQVEAKPFDAPVVVAAPAGYYAGEQSPVVVNPVAVFHQDNQEAKIALDTAYHAISGINQSLSELQHEQERLRREVEEVARRGRERNEDQDARQPRSAAGSRPPCAEARVGTVHCDRSVPKGYPVRHARPHAEAGTHRSAEKKAQRPKGCPPHGGRNQSTPHRCPSPRSSAPSQKRGHPARSNSPSKPKKPERKSPRVAQDPKGGKTHPGEPYRDSTTRPIPRDGKDIDKRPQGEKMFWLLKPFKDAKPKRGKTTLWDFYKSLRRAEQRVEREKQDIRRAYERIGGAIDQRKADPKDRFYFPTIVDDFGLAGASKEVAHGVRSVPGKHRGVPMGTAVSPATWIQRISPKDGKPKEARPARQPGIRIHSKRKNAQVRRC